jgi:hypothetical protein
MITNPFRNRLLRDWLCENSDAATARLKAVSTTGWSPFAEFEFDIFLDSRGIQARTISDATKVLIVGRKGWSEWQLRKLLRARSGQRLRVYSQEMFQAFLLKGSDPLNAPRAVIEQFGKGHPALAFLSDVAGFDWPTTMVHGGGGSELAIDALKQGFLKYLGYKVGMWGATEEERRRLLKKAYNARQLPLVFPRRYRNEWGRPRSSVRLPKMAESIATFCKNAKRRRYGMAIAIAEWENDLEWLRLTYHEGRYQFEWPSTEVW